MSYASISAVTNLGKEIVQRILTDFFQALIEISRRSAKEARIKISQSGILCLFRNRELSF